MVDIITIGESLVEFSTNQKMQNVCTNTMAEILWLLQLLQNV